MRKTKLFVAVGAAIGLALCLMACEADVKTEYVEKQYVAPVLFASEDAGENGVKVTMTSATPGADIYYTTDEGSTPTDKSRHYRESVSFTKNTTLKAIAIKKGMEDSPVSSAFVSITQKTVTEIVDKLVPVDKNYAAPVTFASEDAEENGVKVTMTTATESAAIYYTTDSTTPTAESMLYSGAVIFDTDTTVKAIAVKEGLEDSPVSSAFVSITKKTVEVIKEVTVPAGTYTVKHLVKNLTDDNYSVFDTVEENRKIPDGSILTDIALENKGLSAKSMVVSEDTVTVFYNRNEITYTFYANGKTADGKADITGTFTVDGEKKATMEVSGLYGAVVKRQIPAADDFFCNGWTPILPSRFGEEDMSFTAVWKEKGSIPEDFVFVNGDTVEGQGKRM